MSALSSDLSPLPSSLPSALLSPLPSPLPSPPKRPHEAPPVKITTPPFSPPAPRPSPPFPDMLWLAQADVITVPLLTFSHCPFVQVVLAGHPALFLLDTSMQQTSIDAAASNDLNSPAAQSLQIGELRLLHIPSVGNGVRAFAHTYFGTQADGVIGRDLLERFPVALNSKNGTFSVFRTSQAAALRRPAQSNVVALVTVAGIPAIPVFINGVSAGLFSVDSGSGMDLEARSEALRSKRIAMNATLAELPEARVNGSMQGRTARAASATLGSVQIAGPLIALPDERQRWFPDGIDGMIGGRLLERMNLTIDLPGRNLVLSSAQTLEPSPYDRSGAWLISRSGMLYIHDVLRGSPADAAGLGIGDEILKINSVSISNLDMVRQALMQPAGTRVIVTYRRARRSRSVTLVLRNLL